METSRDNESKQIRDFKDRIRYLNYQEEFLLKRFDFRYNVVTGRIEFIRYGTKEEFTELNDFETNSILREMKYEWKK